MSCNFPLLLQQCHNGESEIDSEKGYFHSLLKNVKLILHRKCSNAPIDSLLQLHYHNCGNSVLGFSTHIILGAMWSCIWFKGIQDSSKLLMHWGFCKQVTAVSETENFLHHCFLSTEINNT